jgi:hypothetical protein
VHHARGLDPARCYDRRVSDHGERLEKLSERVSAAKEFL